MLGIIEKLGLVLIPFFRYFSPRNAIIAALSVQYFKSGKIIFLSGIFSLIYFLKKLFAATPPAITQD